MAKYLSMRGLVVFGAVSADCFLDDLPHEPPNAVGVYASTSGRADLDEYVWRGVQVVVRSDGAAGRARTGYQRAQSILDELHGLRYVTLDAGGPDSMRLLWCMAASDTPVNIGDDDTGRPRWSVTFDLYTVHETAHSIR